MSSSNKYTDFEINFDHPMRSLSDHTKDIPIWHELVNFLDQITIQSSKGPIKFKLDWRNAKEFIADAEKNILDLKDLENLIKDIEDPTEQQNFLNKYITERMIDASVQRKLIIGCSILNTRDEDNNNNVNHVAYLLHLIFLAMNLASPGSLDLWDTTITWEGKTQETPEKLLRLNGTTLGSLYQLSDKLQWPQLEIISVRKVWKWIEKLSLGTKSFSQSSVERAIFSLFHTCTEDKNISQAGLLWQALALEALFDTPELGITKALRDRVFLVLGEPPKNPKQIRKMLTSFYDLRSAFVHGDSEIPNPIYLDFEDDNHFEEMLNHIEFALLIVVATLQKMIINDWHMIKFSEKYLGATNNLP